MRQVYFMRPVGMGGPVKIGCSENPQHRCRMLSRKHMPLEVAAVIPGDYFVERQFHTLFRASHVGKEWFFPTADILSAIEAINAGTFDKAALPEKPVRLPRKAIEYTPERRAKMAEDARRNSQRRREYRMRMDDLAEVVRADPKAA